MRAIRFLSLGFLILAVMAMPAVPWRSSACRSRSLRPNWWILQPLCPQSGYLWMLGYRAYGEEGYFWVPGTWAEPPEAGLLGTPGYWGWSDNAFAWNEGYWGPTIGFYGGVNYGYGYGGVGYGGGYWNNGAFDYNTTVNNVDVTNIHNVYSKP